MDDSALLRQRLRHHRLTARGFATPAETVAAFGAMQAQEFAMACWAVGLRTADADERAILAAFDAGTILRTHVLRPTWHFVAAGDLRWLLALSAPRVHALNAYQNRQLGLNPSQLRRAADILVKTLTAEAPLSRDQLQDSLARHRLRLAGPALAYAVMYAELEGLITSGPRRGNAFTYDLISRRAPPGPRPSQEEALVWLARRYFTTRGPATVRDFANWASFSLRESRAAVAELGDDFASFKRDGNVSYFSAQLPPSRRQPPAAFMLPDYDEYGLSYRNRKAFLLETGRDSSPFAFNRLIAVNGRFVGSWRRTLAGSQRVTVELDLPRRLSPADRRAVHAAVERYAAYLARTLSGP